MLKPSRIHLINFSFTKKTLIVEIIPKKVELIYTKHLFRLQVLCQKYVIPKLKLSKLQLGLSVKMQQNLVNFFHLNPSYSL